MLKHSRPWLIAVALLLAPGAADSVAAGTAYVGAWDAAPFRESMRVATDIELFVLGDLMPPGHEPSICHYRIVGAAAPPDSGMMAALSGLVLRASRESCGEPSECIFQPRFAFRVHDGVPPLDLLISVDCESWSFSRGDESMPRYNPWTRCIRDELRALLEAAGPDPRGQR